MKILVCVKRVPMTGGTIVLTADEQAIETRHLGFTISPHEECGVEEAVRLVEAKGGESVVLTVGPEDALEQLRDAMAIGIDRAIHIETDGEEWDPEATAGAIVTAIAEDEAASGPFDLVLLRQRVGRLGRLPGRPARRAPARPSVREVASRALAVEDGEVRCEQERAGGRDVYRLPLPAVVTVLEGLNLPRFPSVPGRMRAKRKPVAEARPARPDSRLERARLVVPEGKAKQAEVLGEGPAAAPAVVSLLQRIGLV